MKRVQLKIPEAKVNLNCSGLNLPRTSTISSKIQSTIRKTPILPHESHNFQKNSTIIGTLIDTNNYNEDNNVM